MSIEVGSKLQGKVTGITNFGAFVELPNGKTGLVHISEVAHNYVKDIHEHLKVGEQVEVKVVQVESDGKIGLSIKKATERPENDGYKRGPKPGGFRKGGKSFRGSPVQFATFEDKLSRFLKDSEERLSTLKRQTDSKRGGRGSRRS
ncbi:RNA-binding protein S1 [Pueribacillus theae]|uniref:RNA-binding protein S1 n=1 Tax=Pueribacillus theae TaxID=2171751 RepID=A0A2U1K4E4_9BACI|nr:S1 domain-containing RNA-binding protein [Pueribacillus theae]PWA12135.1 RNA-binding protein S1 [Pueribacillus theae]